MPDPLMEKISSSIGFLKEDGYQKTFTLDVLQVLFYDARFSVPEAKKFIFSPVSVPAEKAIEKMMRAVSLHIVKANQLMVGQTYVS